MLTENYIKKISAATVFQRGKKYYDSGRVSQVSRSPKIENVFHATVMGSEEYDVLLELSRDENKLVFYDCDCPAAQMYSGPCKHAVAALLAMSREFGKDDGGTIVGREFFDLFDIAETESEPLRLEESLHIEHTGGKTLAWLEFTVGRIRQYVVKDVNEFLYQAMQGKEYWFGKNFQIKENEYIFQPGKSQFFWELLKEIYGEVQSLVAGFGVYNYGMQWQFFNKRRVHLSPNNLKKVLSYYEENGDSIPLQINNGELITYPLIIGNPELEVIMSDKGGNGQLVLYPENIMSLTADREYIATKNEIWHTDSTWQKEAATVFKAFAKNHCLLVKREWLGEIFSRVLPEIKKVARVSVAEELKQEYKVVPLVAEVFIEYWQDGVACRVLYRYGEQEINPCLPATPIGGLIRDSRKEWRIEQIFERFGFIKKAGRYLQPDEEKTYEFFTDGIVSLAKLADIFYAETFTKKPVQKMPSVMVGVSVNQNDLLEISFAKSSIDFDELVNLLGSYRQKRRYHRLKDGTFVTLASQQLDDLADMLENSGLKKTGNDTVTMPLANALYLDKLSQENNGLELEKSREFRRLVKSVANPELIDLPVPAELEGVIRDYQITGYNWLSTLAAYGLGGILADDMGLGKTLQVIAFLLAHPAGRPALVVAPTSLMYNWLEEIKKFAPELKACAICGTKTERERILRSAGGNNVVITTYNLLQRDIELYETEEFSWCFIDEAQYIKNPATKNARAVKRLRTGGYFALTGTPIENTLTELWSIFDFLMPGYLGTHKRFKQHYEIPIVRAQDERAAKELSRRIAPFILRRLKRDVLTELPDKVEKKLFAEMEDDQRKVYLAYFAQAQKDFAKELKAHGFEASRIKLLALLTRLRQIACDPALFLENYEGGSAKLDLLLEVVTQAVQAGHRMLVFSQFTGMLHHIAARLETNDIGYCYLDGSTPTNERLELVNYFNNSTVPVFLISLKAGGTGLNLTGADMVIHYDPWWNPAVEEQAADRAYRLGQEKNVQVIRLITKNTIEEKIFALQETKKALIDKMIKPGESFITKLSEEEIRDLFA